MIRHPNGTIVSLPAHGGDTNFLYRFGSGNPMYEPPPTLTLTGIITDPAGAPAPNVRILSPVPYPVRAGPFNGNSQEVRTDETGRYTVTYAPPRAGGRANAPAPHIFLVASDASNNLAGVVELDNKSTNQNLRLAPGITVSGTVVDAQTSQPLTTAKLLVTNYLSRDNPVAFQRNTISVDDQGAFEMAGLPQGVFIGMRVNGGDEYHGAVNRELGPRTRPPTGSRYPPSPSSL